MQELLQDNYCKKVQICLTSQKTKQKNSSKDKPKNQKQISKGKGASSIRKHPKRDASLLQLRDRSSKGQEKKKPTPSEESSINQERHGMKSCLKTKN